MDGKSPSNLIPGNISLPIPFPPPGEWLNEGQALEFDPVKTDWTAITFYKTVDNQLHLYIEGVTWPSAIKTYIPLRVPTEDGSAGILHIHWTDKGVRLQQDAYPAKLVDWQPPH